MVITDHINSGARKLPIWVVYAAGLVWPVWLFYLAATGAMGIDPVKALEHELGELGLQALIVGLAITPLRAMVGVNLIRFRRAIGILTFYFVSAHLLVWLILDVQILSEIWKDILKRPYITVGMAAFVLMTPLAVTSNSWSVRKLGPRWRKLHKLVYRTAALGGIHYIMVGKTWEAESLIYMVVILALLGWRVHDSRKKQRGRAAQSGSSTKLA
ncbi:sulfoxide reductase heme-binding subunit YedZ [Aliiroseovarius halocynthiae]|uniref:Protein-methionine-sulfoxide reductase heme-binding subunit MsrQ n=1 Tax=Aliiroseovarius halocynthiae TaxID=985055 RepID=A0A545SP33_9RHOB|nr:protein-methionine-sulfoxide reductase heme-binding subunit MsrQ [Aliiroseovarius halocynthiae]TQV66738.1 protein-methionine-sulfoxide reductase heme-binding subunit MsrQ [Aliiroseovarius halocynthiae]SMR82437.1 sulfoxide reductase heme-binding subunit YedZ [Aliiroseovarius halocynthiae]